MDPEPGAKKVDVLTSTGWPSDILCGERQQSIAEVHCYQALSGFEHSNCVSELHFLHVGIWGIYIHDQAL